ncbi:sensor histidine kinase [Cellulomonas soli]|uniref:sensor histidine kinase n=1 Tax=Cellulomonas soli TaxID=931535 RepID=UPI003F86B058
MSVARAEFDRQVVSGALLVRLVAIMVALVGMLGERITVGILLSVLVLSGTSFAFLVYPGVSRFVTVHPLAVVVDVLLTLAVLAAMGVESPLVLATFSTALILGVLFERRVVAAGAVVLVAGYLLVARMQPDGGAEAGFMVQLGVPALYLCLAGIGTVVRGAHERDVAASRELVAAHRAVAAAEERGRLAREMHDSLGKTLHGIALAAEALPVWVERDPQVATRYAQGLAGGAHQAAAEARDLLVRLRADQPDRPLADVLADLCGRWQEESGVRCAFASSGAVDLSTDARYEVLAVVGEALENVRRHAAAHRVDVRLRGHEDGEVAIEVSDDGCGFEVQEDGRGPSGHFGLVGMHERAAAVGARLEVTSTPGRGTCVRVLVGGSQAEEGTDRDGR